MFKRIIHKLMILLEFGRYNYPTGAFLLLWPCFWGVLYQPNPNVPVLGTLFILTIGAFVMRGAGCCINDLFDRDIDKLVSRTKNRPLAQEKISIKTAIFFTIFQLLIGLVIVIQFSAKVIFLSFLIIPLVISYPLFKRFTNYPQVILGVVFNWGVFVGFFSQNQSLNFGVTCLYLGGVFYTIAYDTIYGFQDISDDKKVGVKSLSIRIEKNKNKFVLILFLTSVFFFIISFFQNVNGSIYFKICSSLTIILIFTIQFYAFYREVSLKRIFDSSVMTGGIISILFVIQYYF